MKENPLEPFQKRKSDEECSEIMVNGSRKKDILSKKSREQFPHSSTSNKSRFSSATASISCVPSIATNQSQSSMLSLEKSPPNVRKNKNSRSTG